MNPVIVKNSPWAGQFQSQGFLVLDADELPFCQQDWHAFKVALNRINYMKVVGGDTGDSHSVWVGRFINDVDRPAKLDPLAGDLLHVLEKIQIKSFFENIVGAKPLCIRRLQANRLAVDDFIGFHVDQDTTPDYLATAILLFNDDYEGGEFVIHHPQDGDKKIKPKKHTMIINRGDIPHQVLPVHKGERHSLACFLSTNFGETVKPRTQFVVES